MTNLVHLEKGFESLEQAKSVRDSIIWQKLEGLSLETVISEWLATLGNRTRVNYHSGLNKLVSFGLIDPFMSLQAFSLVNHDSIVDSIKQLPMSEATKQARAALLISFTRYLERQFKGMFFKALPNKEGTAKTFFRVHEKVVTEAMNQKEWAAFFVELEKINPRDALIGKIALQGGKRINEVLSLATSQINWEKREITFRQSKTRGAVKETVITYPKSIMAEIKELIGAREGFVFLSRNGTPVILNQVANTFAKAGRQAGIPFKVTPHVLRASCVTFLKQAGYSDSDIGKVTGHATSEMVRAYDKSDRADNPTRRVNLV